MANYVRALSTLVSRSIAFEIATLFASLGALPSNAEGYIAAILRKVVVTCKCNKETFDYRRAYAFALSCYYREAFKSKYISLQEYMSFFAEHKQIMFYDYKDFGAFGDLHEILVRLACLPSINFAQPAHLYVKPQQTENGKAIQDIRIRDIPCEIGCNGKTWQEAIPQDFMYGNFEGVAYGMYDNDLINDIIGYCITYMPEKAIETVKNYTCIWANKYDFLHDMQNMGRGKAFAIKSEKVITIFNPSRFGMFQNEIENSKFITLKDFLKR